MAEYIECRNCDAADCRGCNVYILATMLEDGKFDCLMDGSHAVNRFLDVQAVVHGKWIAVDDEEQPCDEWDCSACKQRRTFMCEMDADDMKEYYLYCPNCGAVMDGGINNA